MSGNYAQQDPLQQPYDAIVVGSGATGGWAAKQLAEAGLRVALQEAGRAISPEEFTVHMASYKLRYRDHSPEIVRTRPVQKQCYACMEYNYEWFVNDLENPYSTPAGKPFTWQRLRVLGGRSLVWGRQSYRLSDADFKAASRDGYGDDWPISYADLAPYYDIVERYVGISGAAEGNEMLPDGRFLPPMKMSCGEVLLRERVKAKFGYTVTIGRAAVLTQNYNGRLACHYCGPCERGCMTFSYFSSPFTTVKDAVASGKCTLITNAVVSHVDMDNALNKAQGVTYVDRLTRQVKEVRGKAVILCAQALESTRILLNSSTREYPKGLANSSGALGHYLMDHVVGGGASGAEFNMSAEGYGASFKKAVKEGIYGIGLGGFGESLARWDNYVEIDTNMKDAWGIPALHIVMAHGDNEVALMEDAAATAAEMLESAGAKDIRVQANVEMPGMAIHELGTARMGADPKKAVLNPFNQTHDVKNLFVMDGASFVSSACQNPTLTMMAITVRACDQLIDRFHKNDI